jgi:RHS repeat-associated protein
LTLARRTGARLLAAIAVAAVVVSACGPSPAPTPTPAASPSGSAPAASPSEPPPSAGPSTDLALEACDLTGHVPCEHQAALLSIPATGTGVSLDYSSEWAPGRRDRTGWDAAALGLGGWSPDILQRYDKAGGVLLSGDGSWRLAKGVVLATGERVVPSYDGIRAFVFDADGRHVRTVDARLGITLVTFSYDAAGRLAAADGSLDGTLIHLVVEREADGTLSGLIGSNGARTALFPDPAGQLGGVRDPAGQATVLATSADGLVTAAYDPTGGVTTFAYDDAGRVVSITDPDGTVLTLARTATADTLEVRATAASGSAGVYRSERSASGLVQAYTAPDGTRTTVATGGTGQRAVTLADGTKMTLGAQPDPRWGSDAPVPTPVEETRPDGVVRHATVTVATTVNGGDPLAVGAWSRTDVVEGGTWTQTADPTARTLTWSDPAGRRTVQTYDAVGRLVSEAAPGRPGAALAYDDLGRLVTKTSGTGAAAAKTTYAYGADGVVSMTGPDGVVERVAYDAVGQIVRSESADGATILSGYDGLGRLVRMAPAGRPATTIGRSAAGRQTGFLPPMVGTDGSFETRSYDKDGNLATVSGPGDRSISYTRDGAGRITGWAFDQGTATATWDPATGLLAGITAPGSVAVKLAWAGSIAVGWAVSGPVTGSVADTVDALGRVTGIAVNGAASMAQAYDPAGYLTGVGDVTLSRDAATGSVSGASLGVVKTDREYDEQGRLVGIVASSGGVPVLELRYAYDLRDRLTTVTETRSGGTPVRTTYAYDTSGRLAGVSGDGTAVEQDGYDATGNRVTVRSPAGTLKATYDDRDRLVAWGPARYAYRPDGQLASVTTAGAGSIYAFDDFGSLRSVTLPDGRQVSYLVDASGNRVGRKVGGTVVAGYLYGPDGRLVAQTDAAGTVVARFGYDDAGRLTLVERGTTAYEVVTDHLGSPLLVIDAASGKVADAVTYDAWGNVTSNTAPGFIPIGFAGGLQDPDTGLVKFGAREYDPRTGRWTGPDPIRYDGGDANLYRYVAGDPVNGTDPSGLAGPMTGHDRGHIHPPKGGGGGGGGGGSPTPFPPFNDPNDIPPSGPPIETLPPGPAPWTPPGPPGHQPIDWSGKCIDPGFCKDIQKDLCKLLCGHGEPHEQTGDGVTFGFQAAGEFQVTATPDRSVVVQARMEPVNGSTVVTLGTAIAASVAGDRVGVYAGHPASLVINGKAQSQLDLTVRLPKGGIVERHGMDVTITWPGGSRLGVRAGSHIDFSFIPDATSAPLLRGLLGNVDGNPANDLTTRDGTVIDPNDPALPTKIYDPFGSSWRITQAESLFDYAPGETTATFTKPGIPTGPATVDTLDSVTRTRAEAMCRAMGIARKPTLDDCTLDVGLTGDSSYVAGAAAVSVATATAGAELPGGGAPAFSTVLRHVSGSITKPAQVDRTTFEAKAGDTVYLKATGPCSAGVVWRLVGPSGIGDLALDYTCKDLGRFVLADAGTYAVEVATNADGATGPYAFDILGVPVERVSALAFGKVTSDVITRIGEWHAYTFAAKAGDVVVLDARGACVAGLTWALVAPSGRQNLGNACDDLGRIVLAEAGTYTVQVFSGGTAVGPYSFLVTAGT